MDRPAPTPPQQRDIVYCHECENEWYRDEGGLQCPDCHSDFTEIVEPDHDPRNDDLHIPPDEPQHPLHDHNPWDAPDPDEEDIDHFQWQRTGTAPGDERGGTYRATFDRTYNLGPNGQLQGQGQGQGGGLLGVLGNLVNNLLQQQQQGQQQQAGQNPGLQQQPGSLGAGSAPGSPRGEQQQQQGGPRVIHRHGPGFSFTMTTSGGTLFPRNANQPQPFNSQPENVERMMQQMLSNIGVLPGLRGPGGQPPHFHNDMDDDFAFPNAHNGGPIPFPAGLFHLLGLPGGPAGGVHGDAVYSQEALDRIISQLMEQHQTGNAPGPASEAAIKSLPVRPITAQDLDDSGKADCSICMDAVAPGDPVTVLPCSHWFHGECVAAWLSEHDTCPHCRQGIMPKPPSNANPNDSSADRARQPSQSPLHNQHDWHANANTNIPGAFPSGTGSRDSPYTFPDSPPRPASSAGQNAQPSRDHGAGVFDRMRDAFGSGPGSRP